MNKWYVIYKTHYLFNFAGGYTARLLFPGVLLQQAPFPDNECTVQITFYAYINIFYLFTQALFLSQLLLTFNIYHQGPLNRGWKFVKTKAFLKSVYRVTVDYHLSRPPPSRLVHRN